MQLDLIVTLEKIQQTISPEWVLLEPTGAANPGEVATAVTAHASFVDKVKTIVLLDAPRFEMFSNMMSPMIANQIKAADVIAINKIDEVHGDELATIESTIAAYTNSTVVVSICAEDGTGVDSLLGMIIQND
jgi:G3E family GTPase